MRGFALILVLACHARLPGAAGGYVGLDIFFVLSGFLITGLVLTELERRGSVSISRFYARRAKRLLPLAVTVLAVTVVGSALLLSSLQAEKAAGDVFASALYFVNWHFIAESVDYFQATSGAVDPSPVQHFWSLSVEEQFYLVWPLTLAAGALLARWRAWSMRRTIAALIVPLGLLSLLYSVQYTPGSPDAAYFSSATRAWELAIGGALALALPAGLHMPRRLSALLAGGGLLALVVSCLAFNDATPYPGWRALLPALATVAIIVAGTAAVACGPIRLLSRAPLQFLGKVSYAWYLWHWPAIVFAGALLGSLSPPALLAVTLLAGIPAVLSHYAIEEPFRRSRTLGRRPRLALGVGATCTAAAVFLAIGLQWGSNPPLPTASPEQALGAKAVGPESPRQRSVRMIRPSPSEAPTDKGRLWDDGCVVLPEETDPPQCVYGDPESETTVALLGDSHALQWSPPLIKLAERRGWRLVTMVKAGCVVSQVPYQRDCNVWRYKAMRRLVRRENPDLVVVSNSTGGRYEVVRDGRRLSREQSQRPLIEGFAFTLRRLQRSGA